MSNLSELLNAQLEAAKKDLKEAETELAAVKLKHSVAKTVHSDIEKRIAKVQSQTDESSTK